MGLYKGFRANNVDSVVGELITSLLPDKNLVILSNGSSSRYTHCKL